MTVKGAFQLRYTYTADNAKQVLLVTDITAIDAYQEDTETYQVLSIKVGTATHNSKRYLEVSTLLGGTVVNKSDILISETTTVPPLNIWICIYDTAVSVYCNGRWVYSYVMAFAEYVAYVTTAYLQALGGAITITNIRRDEIPDWRDAVYVDYEATGDNALQSIYQQRPVWVFPQADRILSFTYHTTKDQVSALFVKRYDNKQVNNADISSDGLVYYYDVGVSTYEKAAKEIGLVTRLYRLSELDIGGVEATRTIQEIALERRSPIDSDQRLDPRVEISDRMMYDLIVTGTKMHVQDDAIVEDITLSIEDGKYNMHIAGRRYRDAETLFEHS